MSRVQKQVWLGLAAALAVLPGLVLRLATIRVPRFFKHDWDWAVLGVQAAQMLEGHFRAFRYEQSYLGTAPLFLDMLDFRLLGVTREALFAGSVVFWLLYLGTLFVLARRLFGLGAALAAVWMGSLAPYASLFISCEPSRAYLDLMVWGNLIFVLALAVSGGASRRRHWAALGLCAGVAFWTSFLSAYYLVPVFALLVCTRSLTPARAGLGLAGFGLGSLPFWVHNLYNDRLFKSFDMMHGTGRAHVFENGVQFFVRLNRILGLDWSSAGTAAICAVAVLVLAAAAAMAVKALRNGLSGERERGIALLLGMAGTSFLLSVTSSKYGGLSYGTRYLMPLYTPVWLLAAWAVDGLWRRRAAAGALALLVWTAVPLCDQWRQNDRLRHPSEWLQRDGEYRRDLRLLEDRLAALGARYVCTDDNNQDGINLTFDSAGRGLEFIEPVTHYRPGLSLALDRQERYFRISKYPAFASTLQGMGMRYVEERIGSWRLYHDFAPPAGSWKLLDPDRYAVTVSQGRAEGVSDRVIQTGWSVSGPAWLCLERTGGEPVDCLMLSNKTRFRDRPARLLLERSDDGRTWIPVTAVDVVSGLMAWGARLYERPAAALVTLDTSACRTSRFLRVHAPGNGRWSVTELFALTAAPAPPAESAGVPDADVLRAWLRGRSVAALYAPEPAAAALMDDPGLACFNEYAWDGLESSRVFDRREPDLSVRTAVVVDGPFADLTEAALRDNGLAYRRQALGRAAGFVIEPGAAPAALYWLGFALVGDRSAARSMDAAVGGERALEQGDAGRAALLFEAALRLQPGNYAALRGLVRAGKKDSADPVLAAFRPEQTLDIRFASGARVAGCTWARESGKLAVMVDWERAADARAHPQVLLLDEGGGVVAAADLALRAPELEDREFVPGLRTVFAARVPGAQGRVIPWLAMLGAGGSRDELTSVDGKKARGSRAVLPVCPAPAR